MKKSPIAITLILFALFFAYTCATILVDVGQFAPQSIDASGETGTVTTDIGFQHLNIAAHNALKYNRTFYKVSEYLGYAGLMCGAAIGAMWLISLIKTKKPMQVAPALNAAVVAMALMVVFYVLFEVLKLNYRPVILEDGELEASYPSSHTLLGCVVFSCCALVSTHLVRDRALGKTLSRLFYLLALLIVLFRTLSGVHWVSDIAGGVLLSAAIMYLAEFLLYLQTEALKRAA
ncbi:MAG: phosphatase PAP2 family protein [Clostridia bacterium]|nr:phosphatase PAP2 family protein [Clostridia bacterium]